MMGEDYQEEPEFDSGVEDRIRVLQERIYANAEELLRQVPALVTADLTCRDCLTPTQASVWCDDCVDPAPFCVACCRKVHDPSVTNPRRFHKFEAWVRWTPRPDMSLQRTGGMFPEVLIHELARLEQEMQERIATDLARIEKEMQERIKRKRE